MIFCYEPLVGRRSRLLVPTRCALGYQTNDLNGVWDFPCLARSQLPSTLGQPAVKKPRNGRRGGHRPILY
jgi:hypothetical protein